MNSLSLNPTSSNQTHWISPLKKQTNQRQQSTGISQIRKNLFANNSATSSSKNSTLDFEQLSKIYQLNFLKPSPSTNALTFFTIREQVLSIEKLLHTLSKSIDPKSIRSRIQELLKKKNYEEKMSELGMILFYLDRDQKIPQEKSLVLFRSREIARHIESYLKQHANASANPQIPSGKTHYLLRAFVHMILTSNQIYNRGGLIAIQALLKHPQFSPSKYLEPEHRDHILSVSEKILKNSAFDALFLKQINVDPELRDAIRVDLKLPPRSPINSVLAFYACLMGLFTDVRQGDDPNCYAIASLIYATENHTYQTLSQSIAWLEQGALCIDGCALSLAQILDRRLLFDSDLKTKHKSSDTLTIAPLEQITETMSLKNLPSSSGSPKKIHKTLSSVLSTNNALENFTHTKKLYCAYKYSTIAHLHLAVYEFYMMNPFKGVKATFLLDVIAELKIKESDFKNVFAMKLIQAIWLQNCNSKNTKIKENQLFINKSLIKNTGAHANKLHSILKYSLRLFYLEDGDLILLRSISDLQTALIQILKESKNAYDKNLSISGYENIVSSSQFAKFISIMCTKQINKDSELQEDIPNNLLEKTGILTLTQVGGNEVKVLNSLYKANVSCVKIRRSSTAHKFLNNLTKKLGKINAGLLTEFPKIILNTRNAHTWTLDPLLWKMLTDNRETFTSWIQSTMYRPARKRLRSKIPADTMRKVIRLINRNSQSVSISENIFVKRRFTYAQFKKKIFDNIDLKTTRCAEEIIESTFSKVSITKNKFSIVLQNLNLSINENILIQIYQELPTFLTQPFCLAKKIRLALINNSIAIRDNHQIELAICKAFDFPRPVYLGDYNWFDMYREDPRHVHLVIKHSWVDNSPQYYMRDGKKEFKESQEEYKHVSLVHPPLSTKPKFVTNI